MSNNAEAIQALKAALGEKLSTTQADRDSHGASETYYPPAPPDAVVYAESTQDVAEAVKICAAHGCPVVAWGTGTSLEGHSLPVRGGVTIDLTRMNRVLELRDQDLCVRVQSGVTRRALAVELRNSGLFFPVDPGADASLGGMAATRASGTTAVRYGTMRDNVMALEVVLANGQVIRTGTLARKSSSGYDLTRLFVGSEGTLGIITELTLRLYGQPESIAAAVCDFPDVESAVNAAILCVQMGIPVARVELLNAIQMQAVNLYSGTGYPERPHLFLEFHGSEAGVAEQSAQVAELVADCGGSDFQWSTRTEERNALWRARHDAFYAVKAAQPGGLWMTTDICVPISTLAKAITDTEADLVEHGRRAYILGHVGDGNYHTALRADPDIPGDLEQIKQLADRMARRALALGGTVTGEHGVGLGKMKHMVAEHGEALSVMTALKRSLDPQNILNPGKVVPMN
jgi:D-lactate dehydrogenase (cytochrome)